MSVHCDLWYPLHLSRRMGLQQLPYALWIVWHAANARTIVHSRTATDPFPVEVIA